MQSLIVVYRHQLFKPSEAFITEQTRSFRHFAPLYVGTSLHGKPPHGARVVMLGGNRSFGRLSYSITRKPAPDLLGRLTQSQPSLVHAHFGVDAVYALGLAERLGVPLVTTFHGFDATTSLLSLVSSGRPSLLNYVFFRRRLARRGHIFLCASRFIRDRVIGIGFPAERVVTHYIGVDTKSIKPAHDRAPEKIIVNIGRLVEVKGTIYLLDAFSEISRRDKAARLVIIGDGPLRQQLEAYAVAKNVAERVEFLGYQDHRVVLDHLSRAAVFCLPSIVTHSGVEEGLGISLLEAGAAGVPAVATRTGGIPEAVEDGVTGFVVPQRDSRALADRLATLLASEEIRRAMGQAARQMVERKFDLVRQTEDLEEMYRGVISCSA